MKTLTPVHQPQNRHMLGEKVLHRLCLAISAFLLAPCLANATTIYLDSGTSGTTMPSQSYNENRGADVTVLSAQNLLVSSMTLSGINGTGTAEAEIYNGNTQALLASASGTLTGGTITLPISATLVSGGDYVIAFGGNLTSGTEFLPNSFPYTESSGLLQINAGRDGNIGSFPGTRNSGVPEISLSVTTVPEPSTLALLAISATAFLLRRRSRLQVTATFQSPAAYLAQSRRDDR